MPIVAIFDQTDADPVPLSALAHLPFISEPVHDWNIGSDIALFIRDVFSVPMRSLDESGNYETSRTDQTPERLERAKTDALAGISKFGSSLSPESSTAAALALKYVVAWSALTESVLSESAFSSLPHMLESETDLECSVNLAATHYYKQAAQVLRAFLEGQVVDLALAHDPNAFREWKSGRYHVPSLRGKNGLLRELQSAGVLDNALRGRVDLAYDNLNATVHGAETTLIHSGLFTGEHTGRIFRPEKLDLWSRQVSEVVEISIRMMKAKTRIWLERLRSDPKMCDVCREDTLEEMGSFSFGGAEFLKCRCRLCRSVTSFSKSSGRQVFVVTFDPDQSETKA